MRNFCIGLCVTFLFFITVGVHAGELIAAWSFDDEGDMAKDVTGNGHDGVILSAEYVDGKMGKALVFDGTTSAVNVEHDEKLNIQGAITVAAWVNPSANSSNGTIIQKWGDNSNRRQYQLNMNGITPRWWVSGTGTTWPRATGVTACPIGEWTHVAANYDGTTMMIYINGVLDVQSTNGEGIFASDIHLNIGGYGPDDEINGNRHYAGIIDEVRLWSGALSEDEIIKAMNEVITPDSVAPNGKLGILWGTLRSK